ncbi:hypothetical protein RSOLAG22IIIB_06020 [Rhizoctonia solani]|nr:hypothetical protein RSOLAG22IIIB_06020 [Rhizoctonia solani]
MVWNIIWASAAPPLALIVVTLIDGYAIESSGVASTIAAAMSAKSFVLSLMINLVGQGYIRRQFEQSYPSPPGNLHSSRSQSDRPKNERSPIAQAYATDVELLPRTSLRVGASDNGSGKYHPDDASTKSLSIVKQEESNLDHTVHTIQFTSELKS